MSPIVKPESLLIIIRTLIGVEKTQRRELRKAKAKRIDDVRREFKALIKEEQCRSTSQFVNCRSPYAERKSFFNFSTDSVDMHFIT